MSSSNENEEIFNTLINGNNQFTANMLTGVLQEKPKESIVMSAFSVLTPLAQLTLASEGDSHEELLQAIGMPDDNVTKTAFVESEARLKLVQGDELKTASRVYVNIVYKINADFAALTRDIFNSEVENVFFDENCGKEINSWVEKQTNDRIRNLIDPKSLTSKTAALLVNAIYFKGEWQYKFEKFKTKNKDFYVSATETVQMPMMFQAGQFKYAEDSNLQAQILQIFYKGEEASIVIVLPNKVDGISDLEKKLEDSDAMKNALKGLGKTKVEVTIPKFKIETTIDLRQVLCRMNVSKLFSKGSAQLNKLLQVSNDSLYISDAVQKAFVEINEEGAEAAAANVFSIHCAQSVNRFTPPPPKIFNANKTFYFEIRVGALTIFSGIFKRKL